ncbi:MAG: hypothetical protein WC551_10795 [Patescibacteria group bacterium]
MNPDVIQKVVAGMRDTAYVCTRQDVSDWADRIEAAREKMRGETGNGEHYIVKFGTGNLVVDTGTVADMPAVIVEATDTPGSVGSSAQHLNLPKDRVGDGSLVLTFPTAEQARRVADALVNAPQPQQAVPDAITYQDAELTGYAGAEREHAYANGWNACRAQMLKGDGA